MASKKKLQKIELSMQEIWEATRPNIEKNKKKYERKNKHKNKGYGDED